MIDRSMIRLKGMRGLIMDLLDLTKLESGKKTRNIESVDLKESAQMALNTMEPMAIQKNVSLYLESELETNIQADAEEIEIIFNNLISNAVKYNRPEGKVIVHLSQNQYNFIISVKDNGIGMEEEDIKKLFQDFVRIRNEQTKNISGTGLGLSILKKMVDNYNGDIKINSKINEGTEFIVSLPYQH
jgi:signal transduction histidine kinase